MKDIVQRIKVFEGYSEKPYVCPAGKWTIGFGYNYQDRGFKTSDITEIFKNGFTIQHAEKLLGNDVRECIRALENVYPFFKELSEPRRAVLVDMVYQLGMSGFQKFRKMIAAIQVNDFEKATEEMTDSLWYKQSGRRSEVNCKQMQTGEWQEVEV